MNELMRILLWLPEQASTFALKVDHLHYFVITVTMVASGLIGIVAVYFFFKYRERSARQITPRVVPSVRVELVFITVPLLFFLAWFYQGFRDFVWLAEPPRDALDVYVMGKKWMWKFSYPEGPNAIGRLHVPANRPVRLLLTSRDVIHSFYVPAFRVKQDALPGRYTSTWFEATRPGQYQIFCAEYCGTWHSQMWGEVVVMPAAEFDAWLASQRAGLERRVDSGGTDVSELRGGMAEHGRRLAAVHGCLKCHSLDGSPHVGPTWVDLYRRRSPLEDGTTVIADEAYLTDSMMEPLAHIVRGYRPVMPSFRGRLSHADIAALVEFIKTLRSDRPEPVAPQEATYEPATR